MGLSELCFQQSCDADGVFFPILFLESVVRLMLCNLAGSYWIVFDFG